MKKIFALGAFVFGIAFFAQAQSSTPTPAPKKTSQVTEAPRPTNSDATGIRPSGDVAPTGTTRTTTVRTESNQAPVSTQTSTTTPTRSSVITPDNRVKVGDAAPVRTASPVVRTPAPKN